MYVSICLCPSNRQGRQWHHHFFTRTCWKLLHTLACSNSSWHHISATFMSANTSFHFSCATATATFPQCSMQQHCLSHTIVQCNSFLNVPPTGLATNTENDFISAGSIFCKYFAAAKFCGWERYAAYSLLWGDVFVRSNLLKLQSLLINLFTVCYRLSACAVVGLTS